MRTTCDKKNHRTTRLWILYWRKLQWALTQSGTKHTSGGISKLVVPIFPTHSLYTIGTSASSSQRAGDGIGGRPAYGRTRIKYLKRSGAHCTSPCDALIGWQGLKSTSRLKKRKSQILRPRDLPHDLRESNGPGAHECHVAEREWLAPSDALYLSCASIPLAMALRTPTGSPSWSRVPSAGFCECTTMPLPLVLCICSAAPSIQLEVVYWSGEVNSVLCLLSGRLRNSVCVCVCVYTKLSSNLRLWISLARQANHDALES